ncbi:MAG: acetyl-CoA carboxylase biotin carboxyl carrier protein subunit [Spirochaetaceae bacterium]|jgi:acetyl-CoA carboxylase biotin carboxyl carrier protein|nr:acetyl-CoA carboxylase biotin carboxyl carrier protein subunit [Spirochaetaceae bacterium]
MNEKTILTLIDTFSAGNVDELDLNDGTIHLILRKAAAVNQSVSAYPPKTISEGVTPDTPAVSLGFPVGASSRRRKTAAITSPMVAVFHAALGPDDPPLVKPGARVKIGDTLCILEAMDMMNHLLAEFDGEILSVLAENGDPVEFGQTLFEIKRL